MKMKISNQLSLRIIFCRNALNLLFSLKIMKLLPTNGFILFLINSLLWTAVDYLAIFEFKMLRSISLRPSIDWSLWSFLKVFILLMNLSVNILLSLIFMSSSCLTIYSSSASQSSNTLIWMARKMFIRKNYPIIIRGEK